MDGEGNLLAQYSYDEWGYITGICGDKELAQVNKLRYRSYYYDTETGLYYLQSRYYDAQTGRFLNADEKFVTFNLFAYCSNDPVTELIREKLIDAFPIPQGWYYVIEAFQGFFPC